LLSQTISHYRILNHLGPNVIGEVYVAEDIRLGRKVVLQILSEELTRDGERMNRLAQEARALSALNHPNIRMIYEIGSDVIEGQPHHFIATEFVDGPNLQIHLSQRRMQLEEILDVSLQIAAGLAAAHATGVLHRDLKPENVVLRADGYVKILDFGLAKLLEQDSLMIDLGASPDQLAVVALPDTTEDLDESPGDPYKTRPLDSGDNAKLEARAGGPLPQSATGKLWWAPGTSSYLSPEQVRGEAIDERSDIFSLGVIVYEMCAGRLPFEGQTATNLLNSILQAPLPPLVKFMPDAPDELEWIVVKALAKDRDERYQTARELIGDLKRLKGRLDFEAAQRDSGGGTARSSGRDSGRRTAREAGALSSRSGSSRSLGEAIDSIAILPLVNAISDAASEYLSDGITESIINALSRLPRLRVMARSTVFRYKGRDIDPLEVGRELDVRAVFIGRMLQRGGDLVIKAELVDAVDGALVWAEQYQRKAGDIFELEADIARQISEHLKVKLSSEQQQGLAKRYTENAEAYQLYMRGRYFWNQRSLEGMKKGIEYFVQAVRKDPNYALAYAGMADCYMMLSVYSLPPREFVPKARISIKRALECDDQLAEAHASLGSLSFWYDWDFVLAEREFNRAIELNPNLAEAHQWSAYLCGALDRFDLALEKLRHAHRLDPLSIVIATNTGEILYRAGRFEDAIAECEKALEMDPQFAKALYWRTMAWIASGRLAESITFLKAATAMQGEAGMIANILLAVACARAGRRHQAQPIFEQLLQHSENNYVPPFYLAIIAASLGEGEQAFDWLEKAYRERSGWMPWLKHEPLLDDLHTDARFSDLLRRIGLKP
jgi:serine/threonine-protein kinase